MNVVLESKDLHFRDEVRAFIAENLNEKMRTGQRLTSGSYPEPDVVIPWQKALNERGWFVPLWPKEWGGTEWTGLQRFIFENECAKAGAPLTHPMGTRFVGPVLIRYGSHSQKQRFLPRIRSSDDYWCQGFSEPNAGSDLANLSLRAVRDGSAYILQGSKTWTTNAHYANWMFALVRTSVEEKKQKGISFLLIDMNTPGISVRPIRTIGGDHDVNEVFFDSVRVSCENLIGEEGDGWNCAKYLLEFERGAGILGPRLRSQLIRTAQVIELAGASQATWLGKFGNLCAELDAFEWLETKSLAPLQPGQNPGPVSSILKLRSSRLKQAIAQLGIEALGGSALSWRVGSLGHDPLSDLARVMVPDYCNSRAYTIFGGSAEIQLSLIGRDLLSGI